MKKTKLVPITSFDQLEVGSVIVDVDQRTKVLGKCGLVVFLSDSNNFEASAETSRTLQELQKFDYQLEVNEEPWVPKRGETYWIPMPNYGEADVGQEKWGDEGEDRDRLATNLVCKTREEALAKAQKMLDSIKDSE